MNYYTKCNGNESGPYTKDQIISLIRNGFLRDEDYVKSESHTWTNVSFLKHQNSQTGIDAQKANKIETANLAATLGLGGLGIYQASKVAQQGDLIAEQGDAIGNLSAQLGDRSPLGDLLGNLGDALDSLI